MIFVKSDFIEAFAIEVLPTIKNKFILITHNSDYSRPTQPKSTAMLDDPRLIRWFAENPSFFHPKLSPVPLGFGNGFHKLQDLIDPVLRHPVPMYNRSATNNARNISIYLNFDLSHHKIRRMLVHRFKDVAFTEEVIPKEQYWKRLQQSKFVLSPRGNYDLSGLFYESCWSVQSPCQYLTVRRVQLLGLLDVLGEWCNPNATTSTESYDTRWRVVAGRRGGRKKL